MNRSGGPSDTSDGPPDVSRARINEPRQGGDDVVHPIEYLGLEFTDIPHGLCDLDAGQRLSRRPERRLVPLPSMGKAGGTNRARTDLEFFAVYTPAGTRD